MAVSTADSFLELLEKSNLLNAEQIAQAREAAAENPDARALARALVQKDLISRWQAGQLLAGRTSVFFLGKYKLIEMLGRGGMGGVFLARHTMMNRPVALKVISKQIAKDPAALDRFLTEARAIASLDDPNIVQAYNVDCEDGRYYIVMEYVEGKDLQQIVEEEGPLDFERAADYVRQAADGLAHAHSRSMVHCDIKPSNLLVNPQGVVKILDMGMARLGPANGEDGGGDERVLGTVDYQAPEQALASPAMDHRADIYSLGCTLYFLLTGRPPFGEGTIHERIVKHQAKEPPPIAQFRPNAPKDLVTACRKMMAKKPEDRFQSAAEVSKLLTDWRPPKPKLRKAVALDGAGAEAADEGPAVEASGSGVRPVIGPGPKANVPPWMLIAGAAGAVVLVGLVVLLLVWFSSSAPAEKGPTGTAGQPPARHVPKDKTEEDVFAAKPKMVEDFDPSKAAAPKPGEQPKPPAKPEEKPQPKPPEKPAEKPQPKPEEKPQAKPEEKPPAKPEEKPQPKPPEKPAEKPQPKPEEKPGDPFRDLPPVAELPLLDEKGEALAAAGEAFLVGHVRAADDASWDLTLIGGEKALPGTRQFLPLDKKPGEGGPSWTVVLQNSPKGQEPVKTPVARFWRDKTAIQFQWLQGAEPATANCLRNCVLEVYLAGNTRPVMLAAPVAAPPLEVDLAKGQAKVTAPIRGAPDPERLRIEILSFEGQKAVEKEPKEPAEPKTPISLYLMWTDQNNNAHRVVTFRIASRLVRDGLSLDLRLVDPKPALFKRKPPPAVRDMLDNKRKEIKRRLDADKDRKIPEKERSQMNQQIGVLDRDMWFLDLQTALETGGKVHYRVFIEAGKYKIDLARSQEGPAKPEAPAKPKP